jgi:phosphoserine phosphatase
MTHVVTIVAPQDISGAALEKARAMLSAASTPVWLADGIAADLPFTPENQIDQRALAAQLKERIDRPVDVIVQPIANRRKKLFLADMDSTMIEQECIDELAAYVGLREHVAKITQRAMRGEIAFEPALRERVALIKGLPVSVVDEVIEKHITLTPGGRTLVMTMRAHGMHTCLVSGGFTLFTNRVAAMIGFDETHANKLKIEGEHLAGAVEEPIFGRASKLGSLRSLRARLHIAREDTLVAGDGANDLDMILDAGLGVAFHAKPKVAEAAAARVDHADLTALLYAQGYRREEFVAD